MSLATIFALIGLLGWLYLALLHGRFWQILMAASATDPAIWPSVDIIVPARNEADIVPHILPALLKQNYPGAWRMLLVDDHSNDGTSDLAKKIAADISATEHLTIINAPDLSEGWSGKVAAMQAGVAQSSADYILFTDADILHPTDSLRQLVARAVAQRLDLTSRMVKLHCETSAEKLLIPAFVFFFAMLYPFARANNPNSKMAAAAGGVMLVRRKALNNSGGLQHIKSALIDDCSLAKSIKRAGGDNNTNGRIELTLTSTIHSLRVYPDINLIWRMIARTAFTQLQYSNFLLLGTVLGMGLLFLGPVLLPLFSGFAATAMGFVTCLLMLALYLPMIRFYHQPWYWIVTLPIAAVIYILATIDSARLSWQGRGGQWKGRSQA